MGASQRVCPNLELGGTICRPSHTFPRDVRHLLISQPHAHSCGINRQLDDFAFLEREAIVVGI
jgi:hypothetical protein